MVAAVFIGTFVFFSLYGTKKFFLLNKLSFFALLLASLFFLGLNFQVSSLLTILCFFSILNFSLEEKKKGLLYLTNILSIIMGVSLFCWGVHTLEIFSFPIFRFLDLSIIGNPGFLEDYFFFVCNPAGSLPRFYGIFEEPGVLGVLIAFVLYSNNFEIKRKSVFLLFLAEIFTFSLAGYIISIVSFLSLNLKSIRSLFFAIFFIFFFFFMAYLFLKDGDIFQFLILNKFQNGLDERTSDELNIFFVKYISSPDFFLGMGKGTSSLFTGSGYKLFLIDYGLIGLVSLLLIYTSIAFQSSRKYMLSCLAIYSCSFLAQGNLFLSWPILLFSISCSMLKYRFSKNKEYYTCVKEKV